MHKTQAESLIAREREIERDMGRHRYRRGRGERDRARLKKEPRHLGNPLKLLLTLFQNQLRKNTSISFAFCQTTQVE